MFATKSRMVTIVFALLLTNALNDVYRLLIINRSTASDGKHRTVNSKHSASKERKRASSECIKHESLKDYMAEKTESTISSGGSLCHTPKYLEPIKHRLELGARLEAEGHHVGAELGVKEGNFARDTLRNWPSATEYVLVDLWDSLENYADSANEGDRDAHYQSALRETAPWKEKVTVCRNYTTTCAKIFPDHHFDYIYVDARHDRKGAYLDLETWWPKLKVGGIFAGHDYTSCKPSCEKGNGWDLNFDGTIDPSGLAVKGAVDDFAVEVGRQVVLVYHEQPSQFWTWMMRK